MLTINHCKQEVPNNEQFIIDNKNIVKQCKIIMEINQKIKNKIVLLLEKKEIPKIK